MSQAYRETAQRHPVQQQGLISRALAGLSKLVFWLFAAWLFSILAEWVGMWLWWPEEGVDHSRRMLEREIGYVHRDFAQSLLVEHPAAYVRLFAEVSYHYLFQVTGLERFGLWLHQPPDPDGYRLQLWLRGLFAHIAEHVIAAVNITQVFALRLGVLTLAMPVFVLFGSGRRRRRPGPARPAPLGWGARIELSLPSRQAPGLAQHRAGLGGVLGAPELRDAPSRRARRRPRLRDPSPLRAFASTKTCRNRKHGDTA
jgi:hypothetical protein